MTDSFDEKLAKNVRGLPRAVAEGILEDPEFQRSMNRYMLRTHVVWGVFLGSTIIGLWNIILAFNIPPLISGVVSLGIGLLGLASQIISVRRGRSSNPREKT